MAKSFLTATWKNLLMANYKVEPHVLLPYLPYKTEIDVFEGVCYVSLVGFLFTNTKVMGIHFPYHNTFEEVNLRFYVRYKDGITWKRGVVFIKEIVPKRMITLIANTVYKEKYTTHEMKHYWKIFEKEIEIEYSWKVGKDWNSIKALALKVAVPITKDSIEEFITEHYWGFTKRGSFKTGVYEVTHPQWAAHPVLSYTIHCSFAKLYGKEFAFLENQQPTNVLLAEGSPVSVLPSSEFYNL
ncbi:MAG TPA: DUF2071 domain-containing protein [Chitinophagaceae bacterium]|nr:DUF2071 domain-containing protein [Chitinophagaceae bacterium]